MEENLKRKKQARLQAYQDSLRAAEQAKIEAMMAAMEDSVAMAERISYGSRNGRKH